MGRDGASPSLRIGGISTAVVDTPFGDDGGGPL
jgi:hypothetical protein